jgi:protein associated with RNAse G/E
MNPKELRLIDEVLKGYDYERNGDVFEDDEMENIEDAEFQRLRKEYLYNRNLLLDYLALE